MRTWIGIALVLSLAANAVLWARRARLAEDTVTHDRHLERTNAGRPADSPDTPRATTGEAAKSARVSASPTDLRALAQELKAAGFPSHVVRGMIGAQIGERFAARRRALANSTPVPPFWKPYTFDMRYNAELSALAREQQDQLREVLGDDALSEEARRSQQIRFGPLSDEKLATLERIDRDYGEMRNRLRADMQTDVATTLVGQLPWEREQFEFLEAERRRDLEQLLTAEELREYDLRNSSTSNQLRSRFALFNGTEEEFIALFDLIHPKVSALGPRAGLSTTTSPAGGGSLRVYAGSGGVTNSPEDQQLDAQIKATLGEARYAEFQRALDRDYQSAYRLTERLGLDRANAIGVYQLKQTVNERSTAIRRGADLTPEQRTEAQAALLQETEARLVELLGTQGAAAFKNTASWLNSLQRAVRPPPSRVPAPGGN